MPKVIYESFTKMQNVEFTVEETVDINLCIEVHIEDIDAFDIKDAVDSLEHCISNNDYHSLQSIDLSTWHAFAAKVKDVLRVTVKKGSD